MERNQPETLEPDVNAVSAAETDTLFSVLANANRRFVLAHLSQRENPPTLETLAVALAASSDDLSPEDARVVLHHVHLPKLEDAGLVAYDDTVRLTDAAVDSPGLVEGL